MKRATLSLWALISLAAILGASAQGTAFTYQGRLDQNAAPVTGSYDLRFTIYDAATEGLQQGSTITSTATPVSNGLFTVQLDFGSGIFTGPGRWLEIGARTNGGGAFATLAPRQRVTATPYAITATTASSIPDTGLSPNVALRNGGNIFNDNQILTGKLGVGGVDPAADLHVFGDAIIGTGQHDADLLLDDISSAKWLFTTAGFKLSILNDTAGGPFVEKMVIQNNGSVGIGSPAPGLNRLQINPQFHIAQGYGLQVNHSEYGANIQINRNTGEGGLGLVIDNSGNGDANTGLLLVRNNVAAGAFSALDVRANGAVGIGTSAGAFPLTFASALGDKISLWGSSGNHFGFGIQGSLLQIHTDITNSDIAFGHGRSSSFTETVRFKGNGNVGIGKTSPVQPLQVGGNFGKEGMMRFESSAFSGAGRAWDVGVPLNETNVSGRFFSFIIDDAGRADTDFLVRWDNGFVGIGKTNPATRLDVAGEVTCTAVNVTSDRNAKEGFRNVNARAVLDKVAHLPISEWQYKTQNDARHIGPMAQDFHEAFGLGRDDKHITSVDADGVALAAIQGLNEKVDTQTRDKDARIHELEKTVEALKEMLHRLAEKDSSAR